MTEELDESKRRLVATGLMLAGGLVATCATARGALAEEPEDMKNEPIEPQGEKEKEVTPPEDLMREHGVLDRVLLIYEAVMRRFGSGEDFDPAVITDSANIVREFIEDYHEKLEENYVFPRRRGKWTGSPASCSSNTRQGAASPI